MIIRHCAGLIHCSSGCPDVENAPHMRHYGNVLQTHLHDNYQTLPNQQRFDIVSVPNQIPPVPPYHQVPQSCLRVMPYSHVS